MKKSRFTLFALVAISAIALIGCGAAETPPSELEAARSVASENAKFNAVRYRADYFPDATIYARGDSTQSKTCPQGDGWVSIDLLTKGTVVAKLKCSSYSGNIACMTDADFMKRAAYAEQEGRCSTEVPYPITKLGG